MQIQAVEAVELQNIIFSRYRVLLYSHRHSNNNQSSSRNTSVSCGPNLRSNSRPSKTVTNNTSGDKGDDDPRKQSRVRLKHQCETEDKHDTFVDTLESTPDLSSRDCSNSKLDIAEINPTPLVKVTPSESEESNGNKIPVVRRRQPTIYHVKLIGRSKKHACQL